MNQLQKFKNRAYGRSKERKKKQFTSLNSNANYCAPMKLVPMNMDYCLLWFGAWKFYLDVCLHWVSLSNFIFFKLYLYGGSLPNFIFFNVNPQIWQRNRKVHRLNFFDANFRSISNISLRDVRSRIYN